MLSQSLVDVYIPYLQSAETLWTEAKSKELNPLVKANFLSQLENFVSILQNAQGSIDDRIYLKPCDKIQPDQLQNSADYLAMATNGEKLQAMEETLKVWIRQMEQVGLLLLLVPKRSVLFSGFGRKRTDPSRSR